ncbi:hypothetical protein N7535_006903 [Penicillium sp. DV-2018c]|nr:hypothetical protein N7535_006903 [Penicillium sp. DV-2018c]
MVNSLWFKWKKLRLPWRKSFLVGEDLSGNTFWEFKDVLNASRYRRIVRFDPKTHYSDVQVTREFRRMQGRRMLIPVDRRPQACSEANKPETSLDSDPHGLTCYINTAQWHQWLRHVRQHPPSIEEQKQDLVRQAQIEQLARLADERWASKASYLDKPKTQQPMPPTQVSDPTLNPRSADTDSTQHAPTSTTAPGAVPEAPPAQPQAPKEDPWAKANAAGPGDEWQPESWTPSSKR